MPDLRNTEEHLNRIEKALTDRVSRFAVTATDALESLTALRATIAELEASAKKNQRMFDLVRYQRHALFTDGLITDAEFAGIVQDHPAVSRLEDYDVVRQQLAEMERKANQTQAGNPSDTETYGEFIRSELGSPSIPSACRDCGAMRSVEQGGRIFTVCDDCWGNTGSPLNPPCSEESVANRESGIHAPLTGAAYWEFLELTAERVNAWPDWKKGERSALPIRAPRQEDAPAPEGSSGRGVGSGPLPGRIVTAVQTGEKTHFITQPKSDSNQEDAPANKGLPGEKPHA